MIPGARDMEESGGKGLPWPRWAGSGERRRPASQQGAEPHLGQEKRQPVGLPCLCLVLRLVLRVGGDRGARLGCLSRLEPRIVPEQDWPVGSGISRSGGERPLCRWMLRDEDGRSLLWSLGASAWGMPQTLWGLVPWVFSRPRPQSICFCRYGHPRFCFLLRPQVCYCLSSGAAH